MVEAATADDPQTVINHLPTSLQDRFKTLSGPSKTQLLNKLLVMRQLEAEGMKVHQTDDNGGWEISKKDGAKITIRSRGAFIFGLEALVLLDVTDGKDASAYIVGLRLEGDDWRVTELGPWDSRRIDTLLPSPEQTPSESAATSTLKVLNNALTMFATIYRQIGYPSRLQYLSGSRGQDPSSEHAMLIDKSLLTEPMVRSGYEFRYTFLSPLHYSITATQMDFAKTGERNFFIDETSTIRFTQQNRPATADDPALQ